MWVQGFSLSGVISIGDFLSPQTAGNLRREIFYFKIASLSEIAKPTSHVYMNLNGMEVPKRS
jgi:hypothetical protein